MTCDHESEYREERAERARKRGLVRLMLARSAMDEEPMEDCDD